MTNESKRRSVKLDERLYQRMKVLAEKEGVFIGWQMDKAAVNYLISKKAR